MKKVGLCIVCWNRPKYFQQLITSLEANRISLDRVDCHLFVDGNMCMFTNIKMTDDKLIEECIDIWNKALLPQKQLHKRFNNASVAIHQFEMMQYMTSIYDHVIFLEDDVVVSPNFVAIMKNVLRSYHNNKDVFSVSPGFKLLCDKKYLDESSNKMVFTEGHFWTEAIWSHKWKKIVPKMKEYINIVERKPYISRDSKRIIALFTAGGRTMPASSQDNAKDWAISRTKMRRVRLVVNRATSIGEKGIHSTKEKLLKSGEGHNKIPVFENEDKFEFITI